MADFGTPAHKLHRKDGTDTSKAAAYQVNTTRLEKLVYEAVKSFGSRGCVQDQVLAMFPGDNKGSNYGSYTGRFASLLEKQLIFDTQEKRVASSSRRQRVLVADIFLNDIEKAHYYAMYMNSRKKKERSHNSEDKIKVETAKLCVQIIKSCKSVEQAAHKIGGYFNL